MTEARKGGRRLRVRNRVGVRVEAKGKEIQGRRRERSINKLRLMPEQDRRFCLMKYAED